MGVRMSQYYGTVATLAVRVPHLTAEQALLNLTKQSLTQPLTHGKLILYHTVVCTCAARTHTQYS